MNIERVVLGADDPEMREIEALTRAAGIEVVYAIARAIGGPRVTGASAYEVAHPLPEQGDLWVECQPAGGLPEGVARADHHRPGDPGFGLPPAEFMRASSLGQVIAALAPRLSEIASLEAWGSASQFRFSDGTRRPATYWTPSSGIGVDAYAVGFWDFVEDSTAPLGVWRQPVRHRDWQVPWSVGIGDGWAIPPDRLLLVAAADHCLAAAYARCCPGVDAGALLQWRLTDPSSPHRSEPDPDRPGQRREVPLEEVLRRAATARALLELSSGAALTDEVLSAGERASLATHLRALADEWAQEPDGPPPTWAEGFDCRDLRGIPPERLVGLPIADTGSWMGVAYLLHVREGGPEGPLKMVLGGCGEGSVPGVVPMGAWESWSAAQGYERPYGDPARGFAGAYMKEV